MTPQEALTLQPGDVVYNGSHICRVIAVISPGFFCPGVELRLNAGHSDLYLPPHSVHLLYRKDEVPPGFGNGTNRAADMAEAERILAARSQRNHGKGGAQ